MAPADWGEEGTWDTEPVAMAGSGCKGAWKADFLGGGEDEHSQGCYGLTLQSCSWARKDCPSLRRKGLLPFQTTPPRNRGRRWVLGRPPQVEEVRLPLAEGRGHIRTQSRTGEPWDLKRQEDTL